MEKESAYARALTIYLLKEDVVHPLDAVAEPLPDLDSIEIAPGKEWVICVRNSKNKKPDWVDFFRGFFDISKFGFSSSVSAALIIPNDGRFWAVTFGRGRFLLREGIIEERFGLRTALNAVGRDKVRSIDKETFDSFAPQARQQAIDDTEFNNFGVDVDRDLLYAVVGVPKDPSLGRRLAGRDSLCAAAKVSITGLLEYLSLVLTIYNNDAYKLAGFEWVDNIYEVRDRALRRHLDERLIDKLNTKPLENIWLSVPEIVDWQQVLGFTYSNPTPQFFVGDIHLSTYLDAFRQRHLSLDIVSVKRSKVVAVDHDGQPVQRWNAYRCFYAEVEDERGVFLLTGGHWYKINREIVDEIKDWYKKLDIDSELLPGMNEKESEDSYNRRLGVKDGYHLFHCKPISLPANRGSIEFCDLGRSAEEFYDLIHVKRYGASSKLSHLFFQGANSARLFRTSPEFRKALDKSLEETPALLGKFLQEPVRRDYRVVFAIASSSATRLELPLFSKLSLRQALRDLDGLGFRTAVAHVRLPIEERSLKVAKGTRKVF